MLSEIEKQSPESLAVVELADDATKASEMHLALACLLCTKYRRIPVQASFFLFSLQFFFVVHGGKPAGGAASQLCSADLLG